MLTLKVFFKMLLKMMASPLAVIGLLAHVAFIACWAVYGFLPALALWISFCGLSFFVPKRLLDRHLKVVMEAADACERL